jgi:hypothetical protein
LIRTSTLLPFSRLVTSTRVPKGRLRCAAVSRWVSKISPLAVRRPWNLPPYQEARPSSSKPRAATSSSAAAIIALTLFPIDRR